MVDYLCATYSFLKHFDTNLIYIYISVHQLLKKAHTGNPVLEHCFLTNFPVSIFMLLKPQLSTMKLDKIPFSHSLKNIPLHSKKALITSSIQKAESLIKRMRWKAFWFDRRDEEIDQDIEETYGFKTHNTPPPSPVTEGI